MSIIKETDRVPLRQCPILRCLQKRDALIYITDIKEIWTGETESGNLKEHITHFPVNKKTSAVPEASRKDNIIAYIPEYIQGVPVERYYQQSKRESNTNPISHSTPYQSLLNIIVMARILGTYQHERNENIDEYFKAIGVPYIARKMMSASSPRLEIKQDGDKWIIRTISMIRTVESIFTLNTEYEESMPSGEILKNTTTLANGNLVTLSLLPDGSQTIREYEVTDEGVVLIMSHEKSGHVAKRYFKRLT
ncbi:fatty acid-binding protein homolog 5 [Cephus cinctus]|uniref:Fatty acid-binding protein homolog 5 n=1 Tax=Cephus cinctus TaxID=211228 RepID=A0AAJ7C7T5_CEPCN|nr:fatty acid-binding protein homolog 5 [Cephus cinctus]